MSCHPFGHANFSPISAIKILAIVNIVKNRRASIDDDLKSARDLEVKRLRPAGHKELKVNEIRTLLIFSEEAIIRSLASTLW